jgi:hypothetical protein
MKLSSSKLTILFLTVGMLGENAMAASVLANAFSGEGNEMFVRGLGTSGNTTNPFQTVTGAGGSTHPLAGGGSLGFNGQASATASYNSLRASASGSLTNSFYDAAYDHANSTGIPQTYVSQGRADFTQTLQHGGTAVNYTSTYALHVTGTISGNARAAVSITLTHASETPQTWFYDAVGNYDLIIYSQAYVHGAFAQEFSLSINTLYSFGTISLMDGGNYSGSANFGNTLEVVGIDVRDESGTLIPQGTISSDSGQTFNIISIPEPSSSLLAFLGAGFLFRRGRKN